MPNRAQKIRLGIFVVISVVALIALIAFFTSERYLQKTDIYYIAYSDVSVSGLEVGSSVKYLGIKVGTIRDIQIDPQDVSRIIVRVALQPGTPIKEDSRADIASVGITGLKMIEIRGGSQEAELLEPGSYIAAGSSSIADEISGRAEIIAEKLERVLNNLQLATEPQKLDKVTEMADQASRVFARVDTLLAHNNASLQRTIRATETMTTRFDSTSQLLHAAAIRINDIMQSDTLTQILASARDISFKLNEVNLKQLIQELGEVVDRTNRLLIQMDHEFERGSVDFLAGMEQLRSTLDNLHQTSRLLQEDPSILIRGAAYKDAPDRKLDR